MCPSYYFLFLFLFFFSPEVPERNPWNFFPRRSRRGTLETLLLVFFSSSSFVVRRVSMGILETDTWPEQDHKRESTLAQTFEWQDSTSRTNVYCIQFASHGSQLITCQPARLLSVWVPPWRLQVLCAPAPAPGTGWVWLLRRAEALSHSRHGPSISQKDWPYHSSSQSNDTKYHQPQWYPTELMWCARTLVIGDSLSRSR